VEMFVLPTHLRLPTIQMTTGATFSSPNYNQQHSSASPWNLGDHPGAES
jgi:hypothetical protein